jgi:hypothetical protein
MFGALAKTPAKWSIPEKERNHEQLKSRNAALKQQLFSA